MERSDDRAESKSLRTRCATGGRCVTYFVEIDGQHRLGFWLGCCWFTAQHDHKAHDKDCHACSNGHVCAISMQALIAGTRVDGGREGCGWGEGGG